jgi:hypothetical protein
MSALLLSRAGSVVRSLLRSSCRTDGGSLGCVGAGQHVLRMVIAVSKSWSSLSGSVACGRTYTAHSSLGRPTLDGGLLHPLVEMLQ